MIETLDAAADVLYASDIAYSDLPDMLTVKTSTGEIVITADGDDILVGYYRGGSDGQAPEAADIVDPWSLMPTLTKYMEM